MHSHAGCLCLLQGVTLMYSSLTFTTCSRSLTYFSSVSINSWSMFLQEKEEIGCLDEESLLHKSACKRKDGGSKNLASHVMAPLEEGTVRGTTTYVRPIQLS